MRKKSFVSFVRASLALSALVAGLTGCQPEETGEETSPQTTELANTPITDAGGRSARRTEALNYLEKTINDLNSSKQRSEACNSYKPFMRRTEVSYNDEDIEEISTIFGNFLEAEKVGLIEIEDLGNGEYTARTTPLYIEIFGEPDGEVIPKKLCYGKYTFTLYGEPGEVQRINDVLFMDAYLEQTLVIDPKFEKIVTNEKVSQLLRKKVKTQPMLVPIRVQKELNVWDYLLERAKPKPE